MRVARTATNMAAHRTETRPAALEKVGIQNGVSMSSPGAVVLPAHIHTLPARLSNRTMLFLGDSRTQQLSRDLVVALLSTAPFNSFALSAQNASNDQLMRVGFANVPTSGWNIALTPFANRSTADDDAACYLWSGSSFRVCFLMVNRAPLFVNPQLTRAGHGSRYPFSATYLLACWALLTAATSALPNTRVGDATSCLHATGLVRAQDVVVANSGAHENDEAAISVTAQQFANVYRVLTAAADGGPVTPGPCVLWRQVLPQHFNTATGGYAHLLAGSPRGACSARDYPCSPLSPRVLRGAMAEEKSVTNMSEQVFNDIAMPIMLRAGVPVIYTWANTAPLWQYHGGCRWSKTVDCTHFAAHSPVHAIALRATLCSIARDCAKFRLASRVCEVSPCG